MATKRFDSVSEEWVKFIMMNRDRTIIHPAHAYQIVEGPIANDWIATQIDRYRKKENFYVENMPEASTGLSTRVESMPEASTGLSTRVESMPEASTGLSTRVESMPEASGRRTKDKQ